MVSWSVDNWFVVGKLVGWGPRRSSSLELAAYPPALATRAGSLISWLFGWLASSCNSPSALNLPHRNPSALAAMMCTIIGRVEGLTDEEAMGFEALTSWGFGLKTFGWYSRRRF